MDRKIDFYSTTSASQLALYRFLKSCVDRNTLTCAYNELILSHFEYCCEVWDTIGVNLSDRLQKLQNGDVRIINGRKTERGRSELGLNEINFKILKERIELDFKSSYINRDTASLMYNKTHDLTPEKLIDI